VFSYLTSQVTEAIGQGAHLCKSTKRTHDHIGKSLSKDLQNKATLVFSSSSRTNWTHQTRAATRRTTNRHRFDLLDWTHRIPLTRALTRSAGAQTAAAMASISIVAIEQGCVEGVAESVARRRVGIIETVGEARDVGEH
jgi:hypothetical protein